MNGLARRQGEKGEDLACGFLRRKGYQLVMRNYRVPGGEIDLVMRHGSMLAFVEVKARNSGRYGYPEESVTMQKQERMSKAARHFLARFPVDTSYRFDIIAIEHLDSAQPAITHIENFLDFSLC
ncbi:YraN family protein [Candidatus Uhrbacteria bacterium]|nr:YraN family protein [Candidatus Uhrbacteria bacterium]